MNVRLKKELQVLFWPWLVCAVIGFLPLAAWWATDLLFNAPSNNHSLLNYRQTAYFIANVTFILGVAMLVSLPFGSELQQRTLGMLFCQPLPRCQILREKITAILIVVITLTLAHTAGYLTNLSALLPNLEFAALFLLVMVGSGIFWSLFSRSVLGGIVLSLFSMAALYLFAHILTDVHHFTLSTTYRIPATRLFMVIAALLLAPIFLGLAWLKFSRMEPSVSWENESATAGSTRSSASLPWLRNRRDSPTFNFIIKELYLLKPVYLIMGAFMLLWAGAALGATLVPAKTSLFTNIINAASAIYVPLIIIMAGCASLGEEKKLGIHSANLSLPLSASRQWFFKNLLSSITGVIATVTVFSFMPYLTGNKLDVLPVRALNESHDLTIMVCILILCLVQISFGTAVIANRISLAALLSVIMIIISGISISLGGALGEYFNLPIQKPLYYLVANGQMTCWLAQNYATSANIWIWLLGCLSMIYAGWKCYRYLQSEIQRFIQVLAIMLSVILPLAILRGAAAKQLDWENFMQSTLCQDVQAAFVSMNMDVFPAGKGHEVAVPHHNVMATERISPLTEAWLRDCTFKVIYEPEKIATGSKPTIRVIVQFTKPGRYETIFLKPRSNTP